MRLGEFVPLVALMMSLVALSVDAMLPALPAIGRDLLVAHPNDPQLIVSALILGLAIGQLAYGPLSDSVGRKPAVYAGLALFMLGALLCAFATRFEVMLAGRLLQGLGVAGPRIISVALVRDQFQGREMARVMSFVMAVFILVPTVAPALGQAILLFANWRAIFATFLLIAVVALCWLALRQPETLPPSRRRPFSARGIAASVRQIVTNRVAIGYTIASGLIFVPFIGYLNSAQQIFQESYRVGVRFPAYFAVLALAIGAAAFINGRLVRRYGMRHLAQRAAALLTVASAAFWFAAYHGGGVPPLWQFMVYFIVAFFCVGMLFGNLNAIAMEPLGHIAGVGAAVVGSLATFISVPLGALIGRAYDGTVLPLVGAFALFAAASLAAMRWVDRSAAAARRG